MESELGSYLQILPSVPMQKSRSAVQWALNCPRIGDRTHVHLKTARNRLIVAFHISLLMLLFPTSNESIIPDIHRAFGVF